MATAHLLCDASYNEDIHLGGFSGGFMLTDEQGNDWSHMYNGIAADSASSNEAEMLAIASGAKQLQKTLRSRKQKLSHLDVYTDSKTSIKQYKLYRNGRQHDPKYSNALALMDKYLSAILPPDGLKLHHVKAHVDNEKATPLEAFHNMIDRNALSTRWQAQNHVFSPNRDQSRHYGIVMPAKVAASQAHQLRQLAYTYAREGLVARAAFIGKLPGTLEDHPFYQGLQQAAEDMKKQPKSMIDIQKWDRRGGLLNGAEGMDRVLVRHHYRQLDKYSHHVNFNLAPLQFAGVATRLMYGPQSPRRINDVELTGRMEPASRFIVNVFDGPQKNERPTYTNEWVDTFSHYVDIPQYKGLEDALTMAATPPHWEISDPDAPVKDCIADLVERYGGALEPNQLMMKVVEGLQENGVPLSSEKHVHLLKSIQKVVGHPEKLMQSLINVALKEDERAPDKEPSMSQRSSQQRGPQETAEKREVLRMR